jgi:hypothetical protein
MKYRLHGQELIWRRQAEGGKPSACLFMQELSQDAQSNAAAICIFFFFRILAYPARRWQHVSTRIKPMFLRIFVYHGCRMCTEGTLHDITHY